MSDDRFGAYLDAQQRLLAAGYAIAVTGDSVQGYVVTALRADESRPRFATGRTLSHITIRLADRLAPGMR